MNELLATLGSLISSLGNAQSAGALKEHVALLNTKLQLLKEHVEKLEKENARLIERCAELEKQAAHQAASAEYVEETGALFKRKSGGGYSETPYCPACHSAMFSLSWSIPFSCGNKSCGRMASFSKSRLAEVTAQLP